MPNDLQSPNWNDAPKVDPKDLANQVEARLETMAKDYNANPSKFMSGMKSSGDTLGFGEVSSGPKGGAIEAVKNDSMGSSGSQFLMMGGGGRRTKATVRFEALGSMNTAMGLPKTYKEKKDDARTLSRIAAGKGKKASDPLSGGGDAELASKVRLTSQSLGSEGHYISPQGIKSNPHIAAQLGGAGLSNTLMDARKEDATPSEFRVLAGAADGNDQLKSAAVQVADDVKVNFAQKLSDPKPLMAQLMAPPAPTPPGMGGGDKPA